MEADSPGLFEMAIDSSRRPERRQRGRNRETWICTTTATVTLLDVPAINDAFARQAQNAYTIGGVAEGIPDSELPSRPLDQVAWLVWPTDGMDGALDADAFRVLSVETAVLEEADGGGKLSWEVTVKLRNVDELRRLALAAHPHEAGPIADDLAVAWQRAIDPFAPIRSVPGIAWQPGTVELSHKPARSEP